MSDDPEKLAPTLLSDWHQARQLLDTLREPAKWRRTVNESIQMDGDRLYRQLDVTIADEALEADQVLLVLMKPRKGVVSNISLDERNGRASILGHAAHVKLTQFMILLRFRSLLEAKRAIQPSFKVDEDELLAISNKLLRIASHPDPLEAAKSMNEVFDAPTRQLRGIPHGGDDLLVVLSELLFRLCFEVMDRYYKVVRFSPREGDGILRYKYDQPILDRSRRFRLLKEGMRAPSSAFYVHIPMARLSDHYEFTMSPIKGYYVYSQRVTSGPPPKRLPQLASDRLVEQLLNGPQFTPGSRAPWSSRESGRNLAPKIFVGDGASAVQSMHVGVRLGELPPGATGHAFTSHLFTAFVATCLVLWTFDHSPSASTVAAGVIAGLLALGSSAIDWLIPRANVLNAPLFPRLALFSQAIWMAVLAMWILARDTQGTVLPAAPFWAPFARWVTDWNWLIGVLVLVGILGQLLVLARRVWRGVHAYYREFES